MRWYAAVLTVDTNAGLKHVTVQRRQRGRVRPQPAVRLGVEAHGLDTEIALLSLDEARELARLLMEAAEESEDDA